MHIKDAAKLIHLVAKEHGWWDKERPIPELLCLIHSEASEALEAYRANDSTNPYSANFAEELADIVIRVFDMAEGLGIDIQSEILKKNSFNRSRPYRHGGKKC